jgi:hypothetical protein
MPGNFIHIPFDNAGWNPDEFSVRAIVEKKIVAKILVSSLAIEAFEARGGVGSDNSLAGTETGDVIAHGDNISGQFMSKQRGRNDHPGVVSTNENLDISTTSKCRLYPY